MERVQVSHVIWQKLELASLPDALLMYDQPMQLAACPKHQGVVVLGAGITWNVTGAFVQPPVVAKAPPLAYEAPPDEVLVLEAVVPPTPVVLPFPSELTLPPQASRSGVSTIVK
jgi:hypothetical protein